jgi:hypothetical protein
LLFPILPFQLPWSGMRRSFVFQGTPPALRASVVNRR